MLLSGLFLECEDGIVRPAIEGEVLTADGIWVQAPFLLDTASDRTVLCEPVRALLNQGQVATKGFVGIGGQAVAIVIATKIRFPTSTGGEALFDGQFSAFSDAAALDMSVLGRDIINLFALIVDRPGDVVCLLGQRHRYVIVEQ
jgi:hypothetical protein